jgi:hypothetical protein
MLARVGSNLGNDNRKVCLRAEESAGRPGPLKRAVELAPNAARCAYVYFEQPDTACYRRYYA